MRRELETRLSEIIKNLFGTDVPVVFARTSEVHGDFSCNVAMQLAGRLGQKPRTLAERIVVELEKLEILSRVEIAGPGFINVTLSDSVLGKMTWGATEIEQTLSGQVVVTEYSDPNPFKVLHAGHLYTTLVGDAISNIIEAAGATVHRTNFGGDVGLHVGRAMWGILNQLGGEHVDGLNAVPENDRPQWISTRYVEGNTAYESDETAKAEIIEINKRVYKIHQDNDHVSDFAKIYWICRQWSYDGFAKLYDDLEVKKFDRYYPESQTTEPGLRLADQALKDGVLEASDGAVVYKGEEHGLHTRVFINSAGLPTYETKDLGLNDYKIKDYAYDKNVIITGNDIVEYMKVVLKVMSHFSPDIEEKTTHLTHGILKLPGGKKMSSRAGSVVLADEILASAYDASENKDKQVVLGAVRYSFLKARIGGDIIYDPEESVSMEGNSGPYLQYALVRARSILRKIGDSKAQYDGEDFDVYERSLARKISEYPEVFALALNEYSPHHICTYLYELAQIFNRFYENCRVIDDPRAGVRTRLTIAYEAVLASGLSVLGMPKPEAM
jgi:arginyl-tRNA synthetase